MTSLRAVRAMVVALRNMRPQFDAMYAKVGRPFDCAGETAVAAGALYLNQLD
jgi:hypothetical protein